jgi:putative radical SAM enzyme (TIGR03279 family)
VIRVATVRRDSIGDELGILPGTRLLQINGHELRDTLDLAFYEADESVQLLAETEAGEQVLYDIEKEADRSIGLVPEPDKVRRCTNACPFCFVKGNPKIEKLRAGLYIKDDDYRLSFMFGHYVTLTNLRDDDWERIFEQRLSPLYVSVHATDPVVRQAMLRNPRSADIAAHLDRLAEGGIRIHAQVVLCPELNDGEVLERTVADLYARGDSVLSLSIVPVGLTDYNQDRGVRPLTRSECVRTLDVVERARQRARRERDTSWAYAADELFLQAGLELPGAEYFDDLELVANGVGAVSDIRDRARADLDLLPRLPGTRIVMVTGTSMAPHLAEIGRDVARATGAEVETVRTENRLFGPLVTTAGLLGGEDHLRALRPYADFDIGLISRTAINDDDLFLDDMSLAELRAALPGREIWPSEHVTDVLRDMPPCRP